MPHARRIGLTLIGALALAASMAAAQSSQPFDPLQAVRGTGKSDTDAAAAREKLEQAIEQASEPLPQAQARLALADWLLAVPPAPPATRWLLDMEDQADRHAIAQAAEQASKHIRQARSTLDSMPKAKDDAAKKQRRDLLNAAETLQSFAEIFQRTELGNKTEADQENWRKAGRGLAIAREAGNEELAAAALLWQAFAFEQAGKRDRALDALPDALAKPEHLPYDLMSRLLRCRLMAEAGQSAAAITLLSRMEAQSKNWMTNQNQERNKARRLIGVVQYRIAKQWMESLKASTQPASPQAADTLGPILEAVERSFAEVKDPEVYCMSSAIPLGIATAPKQATPATATATSTATGE